MSVMSCANEGAKVVQSHVYTIKMSMPVQVKTCVGPLYSVWDPVGGRIMLMRGSAASLNVAGFAVLTTDPGNLFHTRTVIGNVANLYVSIVALGMAYLSV